MNQLRYLMKVGIFWGFFAGCSCAAYLVVLGILGFNPFGPLKNIYFSVYGLFFGLSLIYLKRKVESLHFLQALLCSTSLNLTASLVLFSILMGFIASPILEKAVAQYKLDLRKYMANTQKSLVFTEGQNEFSKKYMVRDGQVFRGRILVDSTESELIETEGQRVFDRELRQKHDEFLNQISNLSSKTIATDQTLSFSFVGLLLSFVFSLFFRSRR